MNNFDPAQTATKAIVKSLNVKYELETCASVTEFTAYFDILRTNTLETISKLQTLGLDKEAEQLLSLCEALQSSSSFLTKYENHCAYHNIPSIRGKRPLGMFEPTTLGDVFARELQRAIDEQLITKILQNHQSVVEDQKYQDYREGLNEEQIKHIQDIVPHASRIETTPAPSIANRFINDIKF